jgi:hypothetical protein
MTALRARIPAFFTVFLLTMFALAIWFAMDWRYQSRLLPLVISIPTVGMLLIQLAWDLLKPPKAGQSIAAAMDLPVDATVPTRTVLIRAGVMYGWLVGLVLSIWLIGFVVSIPLFVCLYLTISGRETWYVILAGTSAIAALEVGLFHKTLHVYWAQPVFPVFKDAILAFIGD